MEYMHELKEMLCEELEKIVREGELTAGSLETVDKLTHSIKSIATIMAMEDSEYSYDNGMGGSSYRGSYRGGSYQGGNSNRGGSYARGGRGGYSRRGGSYARNGRRGGYSRDEEIDKMVEKLEKMVEKTEDPNVKQAIEQAIETIEM